MASDLVDHTEGKNRFIIYLSFLKESQFLLLALFLVKGPPTVENYDQHLMARDLAVL